MFDATAYTIQCKGCLDVKIKAELSNRHRALKAFKAEYAAWAEGRDMVAWEASRDDLERRFSELPDGESDERTALIAETALFSFPPTRPHYDYPVTSATLHALIQPFRSAVELAIATDADGYTRVSCPDCGAVLLAHHSKAGTVKAD